MTRITETRLHNIVEVIQGHCHKLNLIDADETLELTIGSQYFGNSFKIYAFNASKDASRCRHLYFGGYLGMTKKEADLSLCGIRDALGAILYN
jgi:hypothetical protein